jgi:hypothetical protein
MDDISDRPWLPWLAVFKAAYGIDLDPDAVDCPGIEEILETINEPHAQTLLLRFGLDGEKPMSTTSIAKMDGVTTKAIQARLAKVYRLLRNPLRLRILSRCVTPKMALGQWAK